MTAAAAELGKLSAFVRRDALIALSYRAAFVGDALQLAMQVTLFALIGQVVDTDELPTYNGSHATYLEFVVVGSTLTMLTGSLLSRVAQAIRQEQLIGTFEALLVTPTRLATLQAGAVALDAIRIPLRMIVFLTVVTIVFGLGLQPSGVLPAFVILALFAPFVWGLGLISAGAMVTFRRGGAALGIFVTAVGITSGVYFPLSVLPDWLETLASANPFAIAVDALREALIGGAGWDAVSGDVLLLGPLAAGALLLGGIAFEAAVARERRQGTLGLY